MPKIVKLLFVAIAIGFLILVGMLVNFGRPPVRIVKPVEVAKVEQEVFDNPMILGAGTEIYSQNFDALTDGDLSGQDSWVTAWNTANNSGDVNAAFNVSGGKGAGVTRVTSQSGCYRIITTQSNGTTIFQSYLGFYNDNDGNMAMFGASDGAVTSDTNWAFNFSYERASGVRTIYLNGATQITLGTTLSGGKQVEAEVDWAAKTVRGRIAGGAWSDTVTLANSKASADRIFIRNGGSGTYSSNFDSILVTYTDPIPPAAVSESESVMMFE